MRLGEILLIYAEAKAELGTLTQADLDKSINQLRDRVGMPHMVLSELTIDPTLEQQYPNVNGNLKNAILEIRRERRVAKVSVKMTYSVGKSGNCSKCHREYTLPN